MKQREELKEENAARNATDGCGRLSLVSLPGGCASAQVEMGQMEGCVFVCGKREREREKGTHTYTHTQRFLGRGGSGYPCSDAVPETPCSRTLSIDLAIKKTGEGRGEKGRKSWEYRLRE